MFYKNIFLYWCHSKIIHSVSKRKKKNSELGLYIISASKEENSTQHPVKQAYISQKLYIENWIKTSNDQTAYGTNVNIWHSLRLV